MSETGARPEPRPDEVLESLPHSPRVEDTEVAETLAEATGPDAPLLDAMNVEDLVVELEGAVAQRDEYLALAQARQAEFENYRKQATKRQSEHLDQAAAALVEKLLPVLDAFDAGVAHGHDELAPMRAQLLVVLSKEGLGRVDPAGQSFDPAEADAVAHEPGDGSGEGPVVVETLRAGWRWKNRLLQPAMVRVKG